MRYLHPNLESKVQAVAKLAANCDHTTRLPWTLVSALRGPRT